MLGWDAAAMMPPGGGAARGDQLAVLAGLAHGMLTAPEVADDLAEAEAAGAGSGPLARRQSAPDAPRPHPRDRAAGRPGGGAGPRQLRLREDLARGAPHRPISPLVRPHLAEVVRLVREQAAALAPALGLSPYDALMDGYQRGIGAADVAPIFAAYETFLRDALPRGRGAPGRAARRRSARRAVPDRRRRRALCRRLSERIGLDFDHARLDRSAHPFSGGTPTDVRITTRYDEADFTQAVMAVMHETGHALYERGLPADYARQPVGEAAGMAAHESQSLIVEMQACRSDAFLAWLGPRAARDVRRRSGAVSPGQSRRGCGGTWRAASSASTPTR